MTLRNAVAHRNLLYLLSMKELKTRYRKSVLGWGWSLLNPITQMVIFTFIFYVFGQTAPVGVPSGVQSFPIYFLSGLLPFQFFSVSVTVSMSAVQGGSSLIKKVKFPHEHLVFSVILAQAVTLAIELAVLSIVLLFAGSMVLPWLPVMCVLMFLLGIFTTGVALGLSAMNVFFHDVNYLWGIIAQLLFYATPIIWVPSQIENETLRQLTNFVPTGSFIKASHEIMYDNHMPDLARWAYLTVVSVIAFAVGATIFSRLSPRFAEEL